MPEIIVPEVQVCSQSVSQSVSGFGTCSIRPESQSEWESKLDRYVSSCQMGPLSMSESFTESVLSPKVAEE